MSLLVPARQPRSRTGTDCARSEQVESEFLGPVAELSCTIVDDDDSAIGFRLGGVLRCQATARFRVGLDLRMSDPNAELSTSGDSSRVELDSGGFHYGILLGYRG